MRIREFKFKKKSGRPKKIVVEMSVDEAMVIAKTFGGFSYASFEEKFPSIGNGLHSEIYDCLVGELFNRFWEDGVNGALRGDDE